MEEQPYISIPQKCKNWQGIKYFCNKLYSDNYELWESKTHPSYKHFMKATVKKN